MTTEVSYAGGPKGVEAELTLKVDGLECRCFLAEFENEGTMRFTADGKAWQVAGPYRLTFMAYPQPPSLLKEEQ